MPNLSQRVAPLQQSGIRRASVQCQQQAGINLGQGICDLPTPASLVSAASQAMQDNHNQYSACEGTQSLRQLLAEKIQGFNGIAIDAQHELMITHGATGAFVCACQALFNEGDEVILFEPFYGYHYGILSLQNVRVVTVPMHPNDFSIDFDQLTDRITSRTRAIVICTPCNPTGKVFQEQELRVIGEIAQRHNLWVITDEIYEYITYPEHQHRSFASLSNHKAFTVTISGFSKTYNMTGWRLGYVSGPAPLIQKMALLQDLLYVCPVTPLQIAMTAAFDFSEAYYQAMRDLYLTKRNAAVSALRAMGFSCATPQGAYYLMLDLNELPFTDDLHAQEYFLQKANVALVPGRSFYVNPQQGQRMLRLCFALESDKVQRGLEAMRVAITQKTACA